MIMSNSFYSLGISHWNCPLEIREQFSIDKKQSIKLISELKSNLGASSFIISTCNRTQVFCHNINVHLLKEKFILFEHSGNQHENFEKYGFMLQGDEAIQNLFEVSAGIDSQILGDLQIFSQVKEGVEIAKNNNCINSHMDRLLQYTSILITKHNLYFKLIKKSNRLQISAKVLPLLLMPLCLKSDKRQNIFEKIKKFWFLVLVKWDNVL